MINLNKCNTSGIETITAYRPGGFDGEIVQYKGSLYRWNDFAVNWFSVDEHTLHFSKNSNNANVYYTHEGVVGSATAGTRFSEPIYFTGHCFTKTVSVANPATVSFRLNGVNLFSDTFLGSVLSTNIPYPVNNPIYQIANLNGKYSLFYASASTSINVESILYYRRIIL